MAFCSNRPDGVKSPQREVEIPGYVWDVELMALRRPHVPHSKMTTPRRPWKRRDSLLGALALFPVTWNRGEPILPSRSGPAAIVRFARRRLTRPENAFF
jgi:hypothetical protein